MGMRPPKPPLNPPRSMKLLPCNISWCKERYWHGHPEQDYLDDGFVYDEKKNRFIRKGEAMDAVMGGEVKWAESMATILELNLGSPFKARLVVDDMIRACDDHGVANMLREIRVVLGVRADVERKRDVKLAESQERGPAHQHPHYWRG